MMMTKVPIPPPIATLPPPEKPRRSSTLSLSRSPLQRIMHPLEMLMMPHCCTGARSLERNVRYASACRLTSERLPTIKEARNQSQRQDRRISDKLKHRDILVDFVTFTSNNSPPWTLPFGDLD